MPYPSSVDLPAFVGNNCPQQSLTLADITAAYAAADATDQQNFWNTLADGTFGFQFIANSLNNGISAGDTYDGGVIVNDLNALGGFYSPTFPPPPPPVLTLPEMITALVGGTSADQVTFKQDIVDVPTWINALSQLNIATLTEEIIALIKACQWTLTSAINFHFGQGINSLGVTYTAPCAWTIIGDIWLGGAPGTTGGIQEMYETGEILAESCANPESASTSSYSVAFSYPATIPGVTGPTEFVPQNVEFFQLMINKLDQLLRCCPPCYYNSPGGGSTITGFGQVLTNPNYIDTVLFAVQTVGDPKLVEYGQPNLARYGKFAWIDEVHGQRPLEWLNFGNDLKCAPSGSCIGFAYILDPGVTMGWNAVWRDGTERHFGLQ